MQPPFSMASTELREEQKTTYSVNERGTKVPVLQPPDITRTLPLPVDEMADGPEVVAHAERVHVVHRGQAQVELQGLLPVLPFDLQRHSDALTFALLQARQLHQ